jgi:SP family facilitated glucose transporter-like MFS transporter 12
VSGAVLRLRKEFTMSCFQQEMIVSSMLMGAVLASLTGGNERENIISLMS